MLLPFVAMVVDPNLLVWVALVAAVQFGLRSMPRPGRMALVVVAAPVAVLLVGTVRALPMLPQSGLVGLLGNGVSWFDAGILTVVVALGVAVAAAAGTAPVAGARRWAAPVAGGLLALGGLLVLILAWQAARARSRRLQLLRRGRPELHRGVAGGPHPRGLRVSRYLVHRPGLG